jgi:serine/threonine protein kinase
MNSDAVCPHDDDLRQLLDGTLSENRQEACTDHMNTCSCCQTKLEGLAAGGTNLSQVLQSLHESEPPANSGYWAAAQLLDAAVEETFVPHARSTRRDVSLSFLEPATDSAYLGRLAQFDVMRILGRGGMGVVLEAFDTRLQRNVALKVLDPDLAGDELSRQRFCREARAAASITHENVVAVHQVEKSGENGLPYLVMQLIAGESLDERLSRDKKLSLREILRISAQVAHGLAAAYSHGLIHRDVKPGNVLLESSHDRVKLTDFGLARVADDVKLTRTGFVSGTPLYMAPESAMGEEADHRSDLFSLGAIMYEMCTGQPPFTGNSALAILKQITDTQHRPVRELNPEIPEWLSETIDRLLAKKPEDRIQSATHLAELLDFQLALMKTSEDVPTICRDEAERQVKRSRRTATLIAIGFLLVGLVGGVLIANRPNPIGTLTSSAEPIALLSASSGSVWSVAFDPSGPSVAMAVEDGSVRLWDLPTKSVKSTFKAHRGAVWASKFAYHADLLATAGDDGLVKLWQTSHTEPFKTFKHSNSVRSIGFSHDDRTLFAGDRDGVLRAWAIDADQPLLETQQPSAIYTIAVSPNDASLATAGNDSTIRLWNAKDLTLKLQMTGHSGPIYGLSFNNDGSRLASSGWDKLVRVWDANSGLLIKSWDGKGADIWGVAFSPDGATLATGGYDGAVKLWEAETGSLLSTFVGHKVAVHTVAFNQDGKLLASGGRDGAVRIWPVR